MIFFDWFILYSIIFHFTTNHQMRIWEKISDYLHGVKQSPEIDLEELNKKFNVEITDEEGFIAPKQYEEGFDCEAVEEELQECTMKNGGLNGCYEILEKYNACSQQYLSKVMREDNQQQLKEARRKFEKDSKKKYVHWMHRVSESRE